MILLDTNHVSVLRMPPSGSRIRLLERMTGTQDQRLGIPIVVIEETMRGWLAAVAKEPHARRQVAAYRELSTLFGFFAAFTIIPFDQAAADQFDAHNRFNGGQLGLHADITRGVVFCELTAKIAFGQTYEVVKDSGATLFQPYGIPGPVTRAYGGSGLYVQPSSAGRS